MWSAWRTSLLAGIAAGCAAVWPLMGTDVLYLSTMTGLIFVYVCLATRLGLWLSRRSRLTPKAALLVLACAALAMFVAAQPIETHAVLSNLPHQSTAQTDAWSWIRLLGIIALAAPVIISFAVGRVVGVPPNTSLERTRER